MDPEENPAPQKRRFAPKRQNRRTAKSTPVPKPEVVEDEIDTEAQELLLKRFNESRQRQQGKIETKSSVRATFINEAKQPTTTRAFNSTEDKGSKQSYESDMMQLDDPNIYSSSAAGPSAMKKASEHTLGRKKEYQEPWNYHTDYPTTLPWRRPHSGNPDILDEVEFGEAAREVEYDETKMNHASELGFLNDTTDDPRLLLFQLPQTLPSSKRSATAKGKEVEGSLPPSDQKGTSGAGSSQGCCSLRDLSAGQMGKLLVYKSGAVRLKLGDTLYEVSPGMDCTFAQELVAVDIKQKVFCEVGGLDKRGIITPDIEYLLNTEIELSKMK